MLKYKNFTLVQPNENQCKQILNVINEFDGSVFHEVELNKIVKKHFGSEMFYFVDNPENIKNFAPVHITKDKFGIKRFHLKPLYDIPYAGFINDNQIDFDAISIGFFESLNYCGYPQFKVNKKNNSIRQFGETSMIDLALEEDYIFNNIIHSKRRNMIRKAEKSGIGVKTFFTSEGLDYFWPILRELHVKLDFTHLTYNYYKDIIDAYGLKKQAFISIAYKDNNPISGIFVFGNTNYMLYYKGASTFGVKNEGQGELLQWEAIKTLKSLKIKYYDLGNLQKELLPSIYRFKTGISNNIINYPINSKHSLGYKVINKIFY